MSKYIHFFYLVSNIEFSFFSCWFVSLYWRLMIRWHPRCVKAHPPAHVTLWIMNWMMAPHTPCTHHLTQFEWWAYAKWKGSIW